MGIDVNAVGFDGVNPSKPFFHTLLGFDGARTAAAIRAGLDHFNSTNFIDTLGEPITGSPIPLKTEIHNIAHRQGGSEHFSTLCKLAIEECAINANLSLPLSGNIPILILGDDTRTKSIIDITDDLFSDSDLFLVEHSHQPFAQAFMQGEASLIHALATANQLLEKGHRYIMLVGVDSWLNTHDIETCLHQERLSTTKVSHGFIPGEAAAACLITQTQQHTHELIVQGLGVGEEKSSLLSNEPCYGIGLAQSIKQALKNANITAEQINLRLSDLNGEPYFFEEAAYAWGRVLRNPSPPSFNHTTIAAHLGNIGCSFGPVIIAYLWQLLRSDRLSQGNILLHLSSVQTLRGAVVLTHEPNMKEYK